MNFLFVNLNWCGRISRKYFRAHLQVPPLDLILLANEAARRGHHARVVDTAAEDSTKLESQLSTADWVIVTTTPYYMWQCPNPDWPFVSKMLTRFPEKRTILTGFHGSVFPEETLRETGMHALILREPEASFRQFLLKGSWRECEGVAYLEDDQLHITAPPSLSNMDDLAVADYCVDISKYGYFLIGRRTGLFEASRGCPWKCTYCNQEMFGWKYRWKSPEVFAKEVLHAVTQTAMETAYFFDLEFTLDRVRTIRICEELIRAGVPKKLRWCCQTRADAVDDGVLDALKAAGCVLIHYGVETANPPVLARTNKGITLSEIERGVRLTKKKGIQTACFFTYGLPGEDAEQFGTTLEFARALNPTYASFRFAYPFPGTALYRQYKKEMKELTATWPDTYYTEWTPCRISRYIAKSFFKFYLFPKKFELQEFAFRLQNLRPKLLYFLSAV